jgi:DNA polymerase III epsilon subunit-like protein
MVDFSRLDEYAQRHAEREAEAWWNKPLVAIDVETTGLDPYMDRICELGVARFENGVCVAQISRYVHPERDPRLIDDKALRVSHIDPRDLISAPPFWAVYNEVAPMLEGAYPVAFNAAFDRVFVLHGVARAWPVRAFAQLPFVLGRDRWIDPCGMARSVYDLYGYRLSDVVRVCGLPKRAGHEARHDAVTAGELAITMGRAHQRFEDLSDLFEHQRQSSAIRGVERAHKKERNAEPTKGAAVAHECDVCFKVEATVTGDPPEGWAQFKHGNLTTCGPACDIIAGWWSSRW